jgi:hypothetical protein
LPAPACVDKDTNNAQPSKQLETTMQTTPMQTTSERETRVAELLMCAPSAYDLLYEINAWMHLSDKPDKTLAWKQWEQLYQTLTERVGVSCAPD